MSAAGHTVKCEELQETLVDFADGCLDSDRTAALDAHCARCAACAESLAALRGVPALLRGGGDPPAVSWEDQRARIMAAVDEIAAADAERRRGFDARMLLPLAAGLVIALAGVISLQSGRRVADVQPARAALLLAMEDPRLNAELSEVLGEPLVLSAPLWSEWSDPAELDAARPVPQAGAPGEVPSHDELSEDEWMEVERMLGV